MFARLLAFALLVVFLGSCSGRETRTGVATETAPAQGGAEEEAAEGIAPRDETASDVHSDSATTLPPFARDTRPTLAGSLFLPELLRPREGEQAALLPEAGDAMEAMQRGDGRAAAIRWQQVRVLAPQWTTAVALQSWSLLSAGAPEEALAAVPPELARRSAASAFARGEALLALDRGAEAEEFLRACLGAAPEDPRLLGDAARAAHAAKHDADALPLLERLALIRPLTPEMSRLRARALLRAGKPVESLAQYELLLADSEDDPELWNEAGMAAFRAAHDQGRASAYQRAARYFENATRLDPQDHRFAYNLGCALDWGEDPTRAEDAYLRALELAPGNLNVVENLVHIYLSQERYTEARALLDEVLRQPLGPKDLMRVQMARERIDAASSPPARGVERADS